jgi:opacity protein-like surface antigen
VLKALGGKRVKRTNYVIGIAAGLFAGGTIPAEAQLMWPATGPQGTYFGVQGGYTNLLTATNEGFNITQGPNLGLDATSLERFSGGYNVGGRAGLQWGAWRLEGEVSYRENDGRGVQMISPRNRLGRGQDAERHSVNEMANVIYDLDLGLGLPISPHIGGGIGAAEVTRNLTNVFGGTHDTVTVFAYQGMAGLRYWLSPAVAIDLDYRYFATTDTTFLSTNVGGDRIHSDYGTHNVIASLVYRFAP